MAHTALVIANYLGSELLIALQMDVERAASCGHTLLGGSMDALLRAA